jgi:hypothetical protein
MQTFLQFLTEAESELDQDLTDMIEMLGGTEVEIDDGAIYVSVESKLVLSKILDNLPEDLDYDVIVYNISDDEVGDYDQDDEEELDFEELSDEFHTYDLVIYTDNLEIEDDLDEVKRIIKINAKGRRRIKMKCKKGYKWTGSGCVVISGKERTKKKRAIRKAVKTKKRKGAGALRKSNILRKRAMKKRKAMGLKSNKR